MSTVLTPFDDEATTASVVASTQHWLELAVIGLNLCPFAKAVHVKRQIRYAVTAATTAEALLAELNHELSLLAQAKPAEIDTTLLIHPRAMTDFIDFHFFLQEADAANKSLGLEGNVQIASFHPAYEFAGSVPDDIANFTNRSPHPMLHLLREASVERAVAAFPDAAAIYERNIETLQRLGHEGWREMGRPTPNDRHMDRPRLFLSAVSDELRTARRAVAATVRTLGFDPTSQDDFPTGYGELRQWLREQIDSCEGVLQIVGQGYGAEPPDVDANYGRVSYTQFEFLYAQRQGKKTWIIVAGEHCQRDTLPAELDLPRNPAVPDPAGYQAERRQLQQDYLARLRTENHLRHRADSDTELQNVVLRLRDELGLLRVRMERQQSRLATLVVAILCGVLVLGGGGWWAYQRLHISVEQAGVVNTEKIRAHLRQTVEETHQRELAEAEQANDWRQRQRLKDAAEAAHTARVGRIDELAASFAEIEGRGVATSVFQEMTRILTGQGVDEAIAYVASQRTSILQTVRSRAAAAQERNRADLQPLLQAAALLENKGQPVEARALYTDVLAAEPDWPAALHAYFWFLAGQGDAARAHTTLAEAQREFSEAHRLALRLTAGDPGNAEWERDLSVSHNKLGDVAVAQGKLDAAVRAYGDGLAIAKKLVAEDPSNTVWQRDLSVWHNKLGDVAVAQGKLDDAARSYGDGVAIRKKLAAGDPSNTMWQRDLSVSYDRLGDVAAALGKLDDAARANGDSLAITKKLAAGDPNNTERQRDLSVSHTRVGDVAVAQGNLGDAARAYGDALAITKKLATGDPSNTEWQRDLSVLHNKLGDVAVAQGKLDDAARAYGDGLAIRKKLVAVDPSNTVWQRDLSVSHNKLGAVAVAQGKLEDAARAYGDGLAITKELAASDPSNTAWQGDLSFSHNNLGAVAVAQGKLDAAARAYGDGLAIRRKLAAGDPSNTAWQRELSYSFFQISRLQAQQKRWSDAITNAEASLETDERLSQLDSTNATWQLDVKASRAWLDQLRQKAAAAP